jgi:hypothetical protein
MAEMPIRGNPANPTDSNSNYGLLPALTKPARIRIFSNLWRQLRCISALQAKKPGISQCLEKSKEAGAVGSNPWKQEF